MGCNKPKVLEKALDVIKEIWASSLKHYGPSSIGKRDSSFSSPYPIGFGTTKTYLEDAMVLWDNGNEHGDSLKVCEDLFLRIQPRIVKASSSQVVQRSSLSSSWSYEHRLLVPSAEEDLE